MMAKKETPQKLKFDELPERKVRLEIEESKSKKNKQAKLVNYLNEVYEFRYNLFSKLVEYRKKDKDDEFITIDEREENNLLSEIWLDGGVSITLIEYRTLVGSNKISYEYEPVKEYLNSLAKWDGKDRFEYFLRQIQLDNEEDRGLLIDLFKKWFITMVGSLVDNDIKNETMLIFSGKEGRKKTRFFLSLIPKELQLHYSYIGGYHFRDKDHIEMLGTKILIINDELDIMNKTEHGVLKSTMSLPYIVVRRAYGRSSLHLWRKASFCGSTNDLEFLTDQGANRRYLPFAVHNIDLYDDFDIRLLYSQALAMFKDHYNLWYTIDEIEKLSMYNQKFRRKTQEEDLIQLHYTIPTNTEIEAGVGVRYLTPAEIMHELASKDEYRKFTVNDQVLIKVGRSLANLGFTKIGKWLPRYKQKRDVWVVKDVSSEQINEIKQGNTEMDNIGL